MDIALMKIFSKKSLFIFVLVAAFAAIILFFINNKEKIPSVVNTDPENGEQNVLETKQIGVNFNSDISAKIKEGVSVNFYPQVDFDSTWLTNTYKIVPKNKLSNNTKYTVKVNYKNKEINSFSFETAVFSQEDIKKYGKLQSQDDYAFGQALTNLVKKYPFYTNLPIKTRNYVVYYDFGQEKFAITFLVSLENSAQKDQLVKDALDNIRKIGVKDPVQYYINITTTPSPSPVP